MPASGTQSAITASSCLHIYLGRLNKLFMLKSMPFHIAQHGESVGQFSREEVLDRLQARAFQPHDQCWQYGMDGWQPLDRVFAQQFWPPPLPASDTASSMPQSLSSGPIFAPSEPFLMSDADDLPEAKPEAVWPQAAPVRNAELKTLLGPVFPPSEPFLDEETAEFKQVVFPASEPISAPAVAAKKPVFLKAAVAPASQPVVKVQTVAVADKPTPVFPPAKELPASAFPPAKELPMSVFPPAKEWPVRVQPVFFDSAHEDEDTPTVAALTAPEAPVFSSCPVPALPVKKSAPPLPLPTQKAVAIRPPIPLQRPAVPPEEPSVPLGTSLGILAFVIGLLAVGWYLYQSVH